MSRIVTGNGFILGVQLFRDGKPFAIPDGSTMKAAVVSDNRKDLLAGPFNIPSDTPGTDWSTSLVIVKLYPADTNGIQRLGPALLEIELTEPSGFIHPSWFVEIQIVKGNIP